jgi:Tfp pilus assembly protein PilZ
MEKLKLAMVSSKENVKQAYLEAVKDLGINVQSFSTVKELYYAMITIPFNGMIVDQETRLKAQKGEQKLMDVLVDIFPSIRLSLDEKTGVITAYYSGQHESGESLEGFILNECRTFIARTIRMDVRMGINFNVILSRDCNFFEKDIIRTVTMNFSKGGCFVYSVDDWDRSMNVWIKINELESDAPILSEVRWVIPWGRSMQIPGIGIEFLNLKPDQLDTFYNKYRI